MVSRLSRTICLAAWPAIALVASLALGMGCATAHPKSYEAIKAQRAAAPTAGQKAAPGALPEAKVPSRLSLRQAVGLALAHSPDQEIALARIRQSEALVDRPWPPSGRCYGPRLLPAGRRAQAPICSPP